jgi:putative oxygen-independent coproporphyrinogen III oxidase
VRRAGGLPPATSVFFGGGTPSLLAPEQLGGVLGAIPRMPDAEVTVECNPETVSSCLLEGYRRVGVNRISLGVQATSPGVLRALGRAHRPQSVPAAVAAVRSAGFPTFNTDLIFGAAGQSLRSWRQTLLTVLELEPPHVSAYALTVEPGTPLAAEPSRHPDPDLQADMYAVADELLTQAGLDWYELSNWARPGHECRHNLLYWQQGGYRGLGCAAHSHADGRRWWNVRTPERYIDAVEANRSAEAGDERLDGDAREIEALQLSLRTRDGVPATALPDDPELDGLLAMNDGRATLTVAGRLLANEVALRVRQPASTAGNSRT